MNEDDQTNIWRGPQKFNTTQIVNCLIRKSQYKEDEDAEEVGKFYKIYIAMTIKEYYPINYFDQDLIQLNIFSIPPAHQNT